MTIGARDSIACLFAFVRRNTCKLHGYIIHVEGELYLVVIEDKTGTFDDRFKRNKGICGIFDPTEERFGRGGHSRLPV